MKYYLTEMIGALGFLAFMAVMMFMLCIAPEINQAIAGGM